MSCHAKISVECDAACLKNFSVGLNLSAQDGTAADTDSHSGEDEDTFMDWQSEESQGRDSASGEDEDTFMDWQSEESQGNGSARNVQSSPPTDRETPVETD